MHRIFQRFIDHLSDGTDIASFRDAMADAATALDLPCFAYLSVPGPRHEPQLVSTYPVGWTTHYLRSRYERLDPVIIQALCHLEPFEWGIGVRQAGLSTAQRQLLEEAVRFGIRCGFTIPIHDRRGQIAAVTFAADMRHPAFVRSVAALNLAHSSRIWTHLLEPARSLRRALLIPSTRYERSSAISASWSPASCARAAFP